MMNKKEQAMGNSFENRVLNTISNVLDSGDRAEFFSDSGTLFVATSVTGMGRVVNAISKLNLGCNLKVNRVGDEYAVDFI